MRKAFLLVGIVLFTVTTGRSQTAVDSIKATIINLFTAMRSSNGRSLGRLFTDSAIMQTVARDKTGETIVKTEKLIDFANIINSMPKGAADERISFDVVQVDGPLAIAWTSYKFYLSGQFSHCGVNSFQLVRQSGQWKIQYLIDTRRKQGCE
jgi:hypothetical protein